MDSVILASITFVSILGGMLVGAFFRRRVPSHHLAEDSKDAVKMGAGVIATLTALILGLLISSAKNSFDTLNSGVAQAGAKAISLDRVLARYGPEATEARRHLQNTLLCAIARVWPEIHRSPESPTFADVMRCIEDLYASTQKLSPQNESQKLLQAQALQISNDIGQLRWQLLEQTENSLPLPFLVILIFWLAGLFASFGLLGTLNRTSFSALVLCGLSVAAAVFLLEEMTHPTAGLLKVSPAPLVKALELLGK